MNVDQFIQDKLQEYPKDLFERYIDPLLEQLPGACSYIIGYGSCLSTTTKSTDSVPDFYVVVQNYKDFFQSGKDRILAKHLPPSIYHFHVNEEIIKYCVISREDLQKEVQIDASDVYHLGRFSKRIALVHEEDVDALEHLTQIHKDATRSAFILSHQNAGPSTDLDQAIQKALALSYVGDVRIEADDKVHKIYLAEEAYYQQIYQPLFDELKNEEQDDSIHFWIRKSRIRARLRWIKNILTASSWRRYMIYKIKRTKGIEIEWTDEQDKFWFIHIWPILWRLQKEKVIK